MTYEHQVEPELIFFYGIPKELLFKKPLASSIQNLETSFHLVALRRYPHALVFCSSAIEGAIKAFFNIGQNSRQSFQILLDRAQKEFPSGKKFEITDLDEFRKKRNKIIHYGFSPKDDEIAAILLLKTGYKFIEQCYETFFQINLWSSGEKSGRLRLDIIDNQLNIAMRIYNKAKALTELNLTYCFFAFAHAIRWWTQHSMLADWQQDILSQEDYVSGAWEYRDNQKQELIWKVFNPSWSFDCPICEEPESFICELDATELDKAQIRLKRGVCVYCNLIIPENCPYLTDELCADQIEEARPKIIDEYGIKLS